VHRVSRFATPFRSGFGVVPGRVFNRLAVVQRLHPFRDDAFDRSGFQSRFGGGVGLIGGRINIIAAGDVVIYQVSPQRPMHPEHLPKPAHT
jgi:hypothetical protein